MDWRSAEPCGGGFLGARAREDLGGDFNVAGFERKASIGGGEVGGGGGGRRGAEKAWGGRGDANCKVATKQGKRAKEQSTSS